MDTLKKTIVGTGIVVTLATGAQVTDYYLVKDVRLAGEELTSYEYDQIRPVLIEKMKGTPTYTEYLMFIDSFNIENKKKQFEIAMNGSAIEAVIGVMELRENKK